MKNFEHNIKRVLYGNANELKKQKYVVQLYDKNRFLRILNNSSVNLYGIWSSIEKLQFVMQKYVLIFI